MKTITLRGLDSSTLNAVKKAASNHGVSMNRFLIDFLQELAGRRREPVTQHHDLDDFFGSWNETEYRKITRGAKAGRKIDGELWP